MKWEEKLGDLRFIVGAYFGVLSVVLGMAGALGYGARPAAFNVNWGVSLAAAVLAVAMVTASLVRPTVRLDP